MKYLVSANGKTDGPLSIEEIRQMVQTGHLKATDFAWTEGWDAWCPLESVPELTPSSEPPNPSEGESASQDAPTADPSNTDKPLSANESRGKEIGTAVGITIGVLLFVAIMAYKLNSRDHSHFNSGGVARLVCGIAAALGWIGHRIGKSFDSSD